MVTTTTTNLLLLLAAVTGESRTLENWKAQSMKFTYKEQNPATKLSTYLTQRINIQPKQPHCVLLPKASSQPVYRNVLERGWYKFTLVTSYLPQRT